STSPACSTRTRRQDLPRATLTEGVTGATSGAEQVVVPPTNGNFDRSARILESHPPPDLSVLRRPSMKTRTALAGLALTALLAPLGAVAPAHASGGGGVRDHGACSKGSHWSLKGKHDSGRIEVEGEIHGRQTGQKWHWVIKHNGSASFRGK